LITIELSENEQKVLIELLNMATSSAGINSTKVARAAIHFEDKISAAVDASKSVGSSDAGDNASGGSER